LMQFQHRLPCLNFEPNPMFFRQRLRGRRAR
jgi:hypothetical protein